MKNIFCGFLSLLFLSAAPAHSEDPQQYAKRVKAFLLIHDPQAAVQEGAEAVREHPSLPIAWESYIRALAATGDEQSMLKAWSEYSKLNADAYEKNDVLEEMAWGVIENGSRSSSPGIRILALIAAFFGNDYRGMQVVKKNLRDGNILIRSAALEVASKMRDEEIADEVLGLIEREDRIDVRLMAIEVAGQSHIKRAKKQLLALLADEKRAPEETAAAAQALVLLSDKPRKEEIQTLAASPRAGLRLLACELTAEYGFLEGIPSIIALLDDSHAEVRSAALLALGIIKPSADKIPFSVVRTRLDEIDDRVAVSAGWLLTLYLPEEGQRFFRSKLSSASAETRCLAAGVLMACGKYGYPLTVEAFHRHPDPFVKVNMAINLIGQRIETAETSEWLYSFLESGNRLMWKEFAIFRAIAPSKVKHDEMIPNKPEAVNQLVRLELLKLMSIAKHPKADLALKKFLKEKTWGISGIASIVLLSEGEGDYADLVEGLLADPDMQVRVQAALVLAMWGRGEQGVPILLQAYSQGDREMKERILESLGKIGDRSALPFLIEKMGESSQSLRIIAASSIAQILYH